MLKRSVKISVRLVLLVLMGIGLTVSTLHSHHNLELHNSSEFADTGHCLTTDYTLCPICANIIEADNVSIDESGTSLFKTDELIKLSDDNELSASVIVSRGRSPPVLG